jgi:hypothetical protein
MIPAVALPEVSDVVAGAVIVNPLMLAYVTTKVLDPMAAAGLSVMFTAGPGPAVVLQVSVTVPPATPAAGVSVSE